MLISNVICHLLVCRSLAVPASIPHIAPLTSVPAPVGTTAPPIDEAVLAVAVLEPCSEELVALDLEVSQWQIVLMQNSGSTTHTRKLHDWCGRRNS